MTNLFPDLDEVQRRVAATAVYHTRQPSQADRINYCVIGLVGEAGELANKWKKHLRGDYAQYDHEISAELYPAEVEGLEGEALDALWYTIQLLTEMGMPLSQAVQTLLDKLARRQAEGKIHGSGDNR